MKRIFVSLLVIVMMLPALAQQLQVEKRVNSLLIFPEFRKAKVLQSFNRSVEADANIYLGKSTLVYKDSNQIKEALNASIVGVQFDDSTKYIIINYADRRMAKVVSQRNYNFLLCVTTVDLEKYNEETRGGANLPFFEIDGGLYGPSAFLETDGDKWEDSKGYPLEDQYFFSVKGTIVPANETAIKPYISKDFKEAFKNKMADRWWSWKDPNNLKDILLFLPE